MLANVQLSHRSRSIQWCPLPASQQFFPLTPFFGDAILSAALLIGLSTATLEG